MERCSRESQFALNPHHVRVRAAEHAPRGPCRLLERRHSLAEIVEGGAFVLVERPRVNPPHHEQEKEETLLAANNYANSLVTLDRFKEAKALFRKIIPVARRIVGNNNCLTLAMRRNYASALCEDTGATLDDLREAVTVLEETDRIARRVLGGAHPRVMGIEQYLRDVRAVLRARETPAAAGSA